MITKIENEKIIEVFSGREIRDLYPNLSGENKEESDPDLSSCDSGLESSLKDVWVELLLNGSDFSPYDK
jgi:hypothetical protein